MKHRIGGLENISMNLGADNIPFELDNSWSNNAEFNKIVDKMLDAALPVLFKDTGCFDFKVELNEKQFKITFGYEPAYKHDPYIMYCITSEYKDSFIKTGVATDYYGKRIKIKYNKKIIDKNCHKEFVDFVDTWYTQLINILN